MNYRSLASDPHWREEELQWARILSTGDAARGMALLLMQKLCTAFHELEPAFAAGAVDVTKTDVFGGQLAKRTRMLLDAMAANGLDGLSVYADLGALLEEVESAGSVARLAELAETAHQLGHKLCDELESGAP